ncbi:flavodoxin family protein [Chloroflexota bacterium]
MERVKVKILGISCAHRKESTTAQLVQYSLKAVEKFGKRISRVAQVETEFIDLADKEISPCLCCNKRYEMPNGGLPWKGAEQPEASCIQQDDYLAKELMPKMAEADGYIFGSPVHTLSFTSQFRLFWERLCAGLWGDWFVNKPAATIAVGYGFFGGEESCLNDMNACITLMQMIPISWMHGNASVTVPRLDLNLAPSNVRVRCFFALMNARRVAELAVMQKVAKRRLGDLHKREFIQHYHAPHGEASWEWRKLDERDEAYLVSL